MIKFNQKITIFLTLVLAVFAWRMISKQQSKPLFKLNGTLIAPSREIPGVDLISTNSTLKRSNDLRGKWTILFFGYTTCPRLCPESLAILATAYKQLRENRKYVQVVLWSLDYLDEGVDAVDGFAKGFDPDFIGVSATDESTKTMLKFFGSPASYDDREKPAEKIIHAGDVLLINPRGEWVSLYRQPLNSEAIYQDVFNLALAGL